MVFTMLTSYNRLCVYDWLFGYNFSRSIHTTHNPHKRLSISLSSSIFS